MHCLGSSGIQQNLIDLAEFGRNGRLWQIAVENGRLRQIAVELVAGHSGKRWKQVGVYKVSRECPMTVPPLQIQAPARHDYSSSR